jgi:REP element-mobilizing transposase RayT
VQYAGAVYHVMNRCVRSEPLYTDPADRRHFLGLLRETCRRYDWLVGAYCLMTNHYHLLVTTLQPTLSRGTQWLNGQYARWLNKTHGHAGHAFFRRFNAILIEDDAQIAGTARYILLNPVRANICDNPADWRWSSYRALTGLEPAPTFLDSAWLVGDFGIDLEHAQANFAAFIREPE